VTHDIQEAMKLGDRICLLNEGHVEQIDTPLGSSIIMTGGSAANARTTPTRCRCPPDNSSGNLFLYISGLEKSCKMI
jgi:ABC-type sulfate/molybdate transport systems ATPase subunit